MSFESIGHHFLSLDCQRKHSFYCHLRRISLIDINIKADFFFFLLLVLKKCKPIVFLTSIFPLEWSTNIHIVASLSLSFILAAFTVSAVFIFDFQQFDLILLSPIVFIELLDIWLNIWHVLSHSLFNYFCLFLDANYAYDALKFFQKLDTLFPSSSSPFFFSFCFTLDIFFRASLVSLSFAMCSLLLNS